MGITKEEKEILDGIVDVHNKYVKLESTHPSDMPDWVNAIHILQNLIGARILRREHPNIFATYKKDNY